MCLINMLYSSVSPRTLDSRHRTMVRVTKVQFQACWPGHRRHAQEDEDQGLAHAAPHLQEVFDGGVGLVGDVGLHIGPHDHAARYEPDNKHKQGVT